MKGGERPCENSTTNTANTATSLFFRTRHVLTTYFRESFSAGLLPAKTTEVRAKGLAPSLLVLRPRAIAFKLAPSLFACPQTSR